MIVATEPKIICDVIFGACMGPVILQLIKDKHYYRVAQAIIAFVMYLIILCS